MVSLNRQWLTVADLLAARQAGVEPLRVLHVVVDGPWGTTRLVEALARSQTQRGKIQVALALRRTRVTPADRIAKLRAEGVEAFLLPAKPNTWMMWRLARLCRSWRPDVVFAHGYSLHLWARYAALAAGVPALVHVEHNCESYRPHRLWQNRLLARATDRIVCVSSSVRAHLCQLGFDAGQIEVLANGIDLGRFPQHARPWAERDLPLAMVGRFDPQKDQVTVVRALGRLRERGLRPQLHFAGGGRPALVEKCQRLARELGVTEQIRFLGLCDDVPALLARTRILVHSTHFEGMPLAVLEGMAAGCSVVASAVPGVTDVVRDGDNGRLFPGRDDAALAEAIAGMLNRPDRACECARRGRACVEAEYSLAHVAARYETLAAEVFSRGERPPERSHGWGMERSRYSAAAAGAGARR